MRRHDWEEVPKSANARIEWQLRRTPEDAWLLVRVETLEEILGSRLKIAQFHVLVV